MNALTVKIITPLFLFMLSVQSRAQLVDVASFGVTANSFSDATGGVKKAIEACRGQSSSILNFPEGRYDFWPDQADEHIYYISNSSSHDEYPSKKQRAGLFFKNLKNIKLQGNNSLFVFHGKMVTWIMDECENIRIENVRIDYERPGMSEIALKEVGPTAVVAVVHPDSKFSIIDQKLQWYGEKWVSKNFFAILVDTTTGMNVYSSWKPFLNSNATVIAPLTVKFTGDFSKFNGKPGEVLTIRDRYRDYVGAFINRSKGISLYKVHMQFMHGLGIVSQFSENLNYSNVFIEPEKNSGRVIASSADGMHFSGCKGQITIDSCRFRGLHDDPVNVHGTHLVVTEVVSSTVLKIRFKHSQTYGFEAFIAGDTVACLRSASLQIYDQRVVKTAKLVSDKEMTIEFTKPAPEALKIGDALENITWTPSLTVKNSRFEGTNTRGMLVTTRRKVIIENNVFYRTGMHAILIENDATGWFESGKVQDVLIKNNVFDNCAYNSAPNNYIINISPQNKELVPNYWVHQNIRIEGNTFKAYDYPLLSARSTNGLTFLNNKIIKTDFLKAGPKRPAIQLTADTRVRIANNHFSPDNQPQITAEKMTKKDIKSDLKFEIK